MSQTGKEYGLIQWSYGRKTQLINYATSKERDWKDIDIQIEFLLTELTGTGPAAGYAQMQWSSQSLNEWKNADTQEKAAIVFCNKFERPGIPKIETRIAMANTYYNTYKGQTVPAGISDGTFAQIAIKCHKYFEDNNFRYVNGNKIPYPNGTNGTDCSAFVTWVLYEYGYKELEGHQLTMSGGTLEKFCKNKGFTKITNLSQVKAGDILMWPGSHTEIVKKDGNYKDTLNCGTTKAIRDPNRGGYGYVKAPSYAYRPKK